MDNSNCQIGLAFKKKISGRASQDSDVVRVPLSACFAARRSTASLAEDIQARCHAAFALRARTTPEEEGIAPWQSVGF